MQLSDMYYRALVSKDTRFDGVFFVGVKSTGIYCRPVCPVRTPNREGCLFFSRAAEAEQEGFRACFRCRPELAPGQASVDACSNLVRMAVEQIQAGFLNEHNVDELAGRLGVTARHLRRSMDQELGMTPSFLAQSRRLAMAKQLLQETALSMTDVAFSSGFSSVRRFNGAFRKQFRCTPSSLRKKKKKLEQPEDSISLRLDYRPPLPWKEILAGCQFRAMKGLEHVDGDTYYRTVRWGTKIGWCSLKPVPKQHALHVTLSLSLLGGVIPILAKLRHKFDLDANPETIALHLKQDAILEPFVLSNPGIRLSGAFASFAQMIRVILGQRISVKAATTVCNRLIEAFGEPIETPFGFLTRVFPSEERLATSPIEDLVALGIPKARAETIQNLSKSVCSGDIRLDGSLDTETFSKKLLAIKGIGAWTVRYALMRLFGEPDIFPASDLELRKALDNRSVREIEGLAEAWRPWRSYAAMLLWNRG